MFFRRKTKENKTKAKNKRKQTVHFSDLVIDLRRSLSHDDGNTFTPNDSNENFLTNDVSLYGPLTYTYSRQLGNVLKGKIGA